MLAGPGSDDVVIHDYSSDIHGPDLPWAAGERRETFIYRHVLRFDPANRPIGASRLLVPADPRVWMH
jgi:hypothetical protein